MTDPVELIPAFEWTCHQCGERNYASSVVREFAELEPEQQAYVLEQFGDSGGVFQETPDSVTCPHCAAEYETHEFIGL